MKRAHLGLILMVLLAPAVAMRQVGAATATGPEDFAFKPHPDAKLPLDARLMDETGRAVALSHYFTGEPVVLVLEYLRCKTFCGLTLSGVVTALDPLQLEAGRDYQFVAVSIDPRDTPAENAAAKEKYLALYHHANGAAGIHFLAGAAPEVRRIADAIGFPYRYDPRVDQYIHPAGFVIATPRGRISQYIFGVAASPPELKSAIIDASRQQAISPLTRFLLLCHVEGVPLGRFTVPVLAALMTADIAAGLCLAALFIAIRRRRHG